MLRWFIDAKEVSNGTPCFFDRRSFCVEGWIVSFHPDSNADDASGFDLIVNTI